MLKLQEGSRPITQELEKCKRHNSQTGLEYSFNELQNLFRKSRWQRCGEQ